LSSWHHAIAHAADRHALAALVNDYLAMWSPMEMALVPPDCRPDRIRGVEDIQFWRERLSEAYLSGGVHRDEGGALSRLIAFFSAAADRVGELSREDLTEEPEPDEGFPAEGRLIRRRETDR
jgi:hypothetical protein